MEQGSAHFAATHRARPSGTASRPRWCLLARPRASLLARWPSWRTSTPPP